ncbi:MAG TPA: hypothetical protein VM307_12235 [Egibacteraceae bacterium]|nr:hypothetical protein [Egibacteraceae bacterium]
MKRRRGLAAVALAAAALLALPTAAIAHPEGEGVDHTKDYGDFEGGPAYDPSHSSHGNADLASPNMFHTANRMNPGKTNSDLAFWKEGGVRGPHQELAAAGNYDGFRLFDIKNPDNPILVSDVQCRGPQNDVSFYRAQDRLLLIMSIDRPQTTPECATSRDTPVSTGVPACEPTPEIPEPECPTAVRTLAQPGFEGLRIFDVSRPETPVQIASVPTACGSHTHTTMRDQDDQRAIIYVSSYPTGASPTPTGAPDFGGPRCTIPHARISIVEIPDAAPENARVLKEQFLHADTLPFLGSVGSGGTGAIGCHDITVYYEDQKQSPTGRQSTQVRSNPRRVAGAACLEEGQIWDVTQPENPSTLGPHTHIRNPFITSGIPGTFKGLFHTASFTWDGEILLFTDEWGGGGAHGCDGPQDTRGNVWFYKNVPPGTPAPVYGRFIIPRPQPQQEACTMHNGNVIPTNQGYFGVSSAYEGGTSVFDFTGVQNNPPIFLDRPAPGTSGEEGVPVPPTVAREVAFFDEQGVDGRGRDDVWSSYWFNDRIFANGGLGRPHNPGGRGFDVYKLLTKGGQLVDANGNPTFKEGDNPNDPRVQTFTARKWSQGNPQTQETNQKTPHTP